MSDPSPTPAVNPELSQPNSSSHPAPKPVVAPEEPKLKRRQKRQRQIRQVLQVLGLPAGGWGITRTIHLLQQGDQFWLAVLVGFSSIGVIVLAVMWTFWSDLINLILDKIEERLEVSTDSLAEWIVAQLESAVVAFWWRITPQFQGAYYESLRYKYRNYLTKGLKTPGVATLKLEKVFVPLRISSQSLEQISPALIQQQEAKGGLEVWDFLRESKQIEVYKRMVVIGAPGSGKSTLLQHITLTYIHNRHRQRSRKVPTLIPVLLPLHEIRNRIAPPKTTAAGAKAASQPTPTLPDLPTVIVEQSQKLPKGKTLKLSPQWFEAKLNNGQCLVMLDGLDEVADEVQRQQVSRWVDGQMGAYPEAYWILTSRPYGYRNAQLTEAGTTLGVQPFSLKQMEQFLRQWYLENEIVRQGGRDPGVEIDAKEKAEDLVGRIKQYQPLADMALNPLLLTMVATVHDNRGALPGNRVDLYDEICDVLLVRRQDAKGLTEPLPLKAEQKKSVLQVLALELMRREQREFSLAEGEAIIADSLRSVGGDRITPAQFIHHVEMVSGLLLEQKVGEYQFAHLSFQEFLASAQIKETQGDRANAFDVLVQNIGESWWHEMIRLYAARNDVTALVEAALANPSVATLTIAYDCLDEGKSIAPETRQHLEEMSLDAADPEKAKLAAEVKLARRLMRLLRVDESVQIDQGYITWAEFQLFLEDTQPAEDGGRSLPTQQPRRQSVTGITLELALDFCVWLRRWQAGDLARESTGDVSFFYRLPTQTEVEQTSSEARELLDCWTIGADTLTIRGLRVVKQQLAVDYARLQYHLVDEDWDEADAVTTEIVSRATQRPANAIYFDTVTAKVIPRKCLQLLDQLWVHYSRGRCGFGMQASLWHLPLKCCGPAGKEPDFGKIAGWQSAPEHQKLSTVPLPGKYPHQGWSVALLYRFMDCGLERVMPLTTFEVITLDSKGKKASSDWKDARLHIEDLGQGIALEMLPIPGGKFLMGSSVDEEGRLDWEGPQHEIAVPPFFMGKYSVTQAQWRQVATLPIVNRRLKSNPSHFNDNDNRPVEQVSWDDAMEFCLRLSAYAKLNYRLPTEAEWEYACRAGTTTPFHFGDTITTEVANYRGQDGEYGGKTYPCRYGKGPFGSFRKKTTVVGEFSANAFGLFDMHGNVWEWCADHWHDSYVGAPTDGGVWSEGGKGDHRIIRSGSWVSFPSNTRSAFRLDIARTSIADDVGFRVVLSPIRGRF